MKESLVSIIIPCYNQAEFLHQTLNSVYLQKYIYWECILINDGSTDQTEEIIKIWTKKDTRFKYFKIDNAGVGNARNIGLLQAKGEWIQFLDADDLLLPHKIFNSLEVSEIENVRVVVCNYDRFYQNIENKLGAFSRLGNYDFNFNNIARYWNAGFTIPIHCFLFHRESIIDYQFPTKITAQEDWAMWLQIYQNNPKTFFLNDVLVLYRYNPNSRTGQKGFFEETLQAINYLNGRLSNSNFIILYESTIKRFQESSMYWMNRERSLKYSNTYQIALLFKKALKKIGFLKLLKPIIQIVLSKYR